MASIRMATPLTAPALPFLLRRGGANESLVNATGNGTVVLESGQVVGEGGLGGVGAAGGAAVVLFVILFGLWGSMGMPTDHMMKGVKAEKKMQAKEEAKAAAAEAGEFFDEEAWDEEYEATKGKMGKRFARPSHYDGDEVVRQSTVRNSTTAYKATREPKTEREILMEMEKLESKLKHLEASEKEFSQSSAQNKSAEEIEAEIARLTKQAERSIQTQIDHMNQQINTRNASGSGVSRSHARI